MSKCCECVLAGRPFLNEDKSVNFEKLAVLFEKWEQEQFVIGIDRRHAFTVINEYAKNLCRCDCHIIREKEEE